MAAQLDLADLKNLQTIVLDLEELRKLQSIAKLPSVRSILSREITNHEAKIFSNSTVSDEKDPEEEEDTGEAKVYPQIAHSARLPQIFVKMVKSVGRAVIQTSSSELGPGHI